MGTLVRLQAVLPRRAVDAIMRLTKGDQLMLSADPAARAAYDARMQQLISGSAPAAAVAPEPERDAA